jgi:hypothetical protein
VGNVNELRDRIIRAAECFTNEMSAGTWLETEYCLDMCYATNGAHKELGEVQFLRIYLFLQCPL